MPDLPRTPRYISTSLARALTILDLFEPSAATLSATQIARSLRVRPGSLYPALSTLERFGYLERRLDAAFAVSHNLFTCRIGASLIKSPSCLCVSLRHGLYIRGPT